MWKTRSRVPNTRAQLLILKITYEDKDHDLYILPVSVAPTEAQGLDEIVATLISEAAERGVLYGALGDNAFRGALLQAVLSEASISGSNGVLIATRTAALSEEWEPAAVQEIDSFVSRAEQSNTSIIYRGHFILKLFRKLEAGINPEVEIGTLFDAAWI